MTGDVSPVGAGPAASELRASHDDRDRVVEQLRVAAGDGRLTAEELDERLERALTARTHGELAVLTADLPAASGGPAGPPPEPKDLVRIQCGSSHTKRDGTWVVPRRMELNVTSGSILLDFTRAVITGRTLDISAQVRSGHLRLITRPGIVVDADDVTVRSGHVQVRAPWDPAVPEVLRITITGRVTSGHLTARPPRRTLWQWLRRAPRPYAAQLTR
jgi:uncharacterized protein DUF1707